MLPKLQILSSTAYTGGQMSILKFALGMILPLCVLSMKELLCTQCIFLRTKQYVEIIFE